MTDRPTGVATKKQSFLLFSSSVSDQSLLETSQHCEKISQMMSFACGCLMALAASGCLLAQRRKGWAKSH